MPRVKLLQVLLAPDATVPPTRSPLSAVGLSQTGYDKTLHIIRPAFLIKAVITTAENSQHVSESCNMAALFYGLVDHTESIQVSLLLKDHLLL